jgi:hypothetical protein
MCCTCVTQSDTLALATHTAGVCLLFFVQHALAYCTALLYKHTFLWQKCSLLRINQRCRNLYGLVRHTPPAAVRNSEIHNPQNTEIQKRNHTFIFFCESGLLRMNQRHTRRAGTHHTAAVKNRRRKVTRVRYLGVGMGGWAGRQFLFLTN